MSGSLSEDLRDLIQAAKGLGLTSRDRTPTDDGTPKYNMDRAIAAMTKLLHATVGGFAALSNGNVLKDPKQAPRLARRVMMTVMNESWCEHTSMIVPQLTYWTTTNPDQLPCVDCLVGKEQSQFHEQFLAHMREVAAVGQAGICGECGESVPSLHSVMLSLESIYIRYDAATPAVIAVAGLCDDCLMAVGVPRSTSPPGPPILS